MRLATVSCVKRMPEQTENDIPSLVARMHELIDEIAPMLDELGRIRSELALLQERDAGVKLSDEG